MRDGMTTYRMDPAARCAREPLECAGTELLAVLVGPNRPRALAALLRAMSPREIARASVAELAPHVGPRAAARIVAAFELGRRAHAEPMEPRTVFYSSSQVERAYRARLQDEPYETFVVVALDARQHPIAERAVQGRPDGVALDLKALLRFAVRQGAAAVLMVHNHPSGDPTPSGEDVAVTTAYRIAFAAIDCPVLDHVIVAREGCFSFLDAGLLDPKGRR
jgi:DNA repair protein RadC